MNNPGYEILLQTMPIALGALALLVMLQIRPGNRKLKIRHTPTNTILNQTFVPRYLGSTNTGAAKIHNFLYDNLVVSGTYPDDSEKKLNQKALEKLGMVAIAELGMLPKLKINSRKLMLLGSFSQKEIGLHLMFHKSKASAVLLSYAAESNLEVLIV